MSYSLDIQSGDFTLSGPGGLSTVSGRDKLIQDLRCWMLEQIGNDPMHPELGSALDGGVLPDGTIIETTIGNIITKKAMLDLENEVRRVISQYQQQQLSKIRSEQMLYGGIYHLDPGEILLGIADVEVTQTGATLVARITIRTAENVLIPLALPVGTI
jgi:hypothetical protein